VFRVLKRSVIMLQMSLQSVRSRCSRRTLEKIIVRSQEIVAGSVLNVWCEAVALLIVG